MKRSWIGYLLVIACVCFCMASCDDKEASSNVETSQSISSEDNVLSENEESSENVSSNESEAVSGEDVSLGETEGTSEDVSSSESEDESSDVEAESTAESSDSTEESSTMESEEESSEDTSEVSKTEESSEDVSEDTSEESSKDTSKDTSKDSSKDSSKDTSKDTSKESSKDTSKDNSKDTSKDTSKDISKDTSKETSKGSSQDSSEEPSSEESSVEESSAVHTHNYKSVVYEPWCGIEGYTEHTCKCGHVYKDNYVDALEHDWGPWFTVQSVSTIQDGINERGCCRCYVWETETIPKIVVTITKEDLDMMAEEALDELNKFRIENGRQPLVTGPIAHQMASERAEQLSVYFSHSLPDGSNGAWEVIAKYKYNEEGIAVGSQTPGTECIIKDHFGWGGGLYKNKISDLKSDARSALRGFQTSSGHWTKLMSDKYTACGIGVYVVLNDPDAPTSRDIYICVLTFDKLYGADAK